MAAKVSQPSISAPLLITAVSVVLTALVWTLAANGVARLDALRFSSEVRQSEAMIQDRMAREIALLKSAKGFLVAFPQATRQDFDRFFGEMDVMGAYPGATGLGWMVKLTPGTAKQLITQAHTEGIHQFRVWTDDPSVEPFAVAYLEPNAFTYRPTFGYNMLSDPGRRDAIAKSRDTGEPVMTGRVKPVKAASESAAFLIFLPVYNTNSNPSTPQERQRALRGFVFCGFRAQSFFDNLYKNATDEIRVDIYDTPGTAADLYFSSGEAALRHGLKQTDKLRVAGREWVVDFQSTPKFAQASASRFLFWIPIMGLFVTGLLAGLSWKQTRVARELSMRTASLQRSEFHQRFLAEAATVLSQSLDYQDTLSSVSNLAVPNFADWCAVDLVDDRGKINRLATAHVNPAKVRWARELQEKWPPDPDSPTGIPNVVRTGKSELYESLSEEMLMASARDDEMRETIRLVGFSSAMIVPINARNRTLGAMTYVWAESGHHYSQDDLRLAEEIADRAGVAIDNSLLYHGSLRDRSEVNRLNEELEQIVQERTAELTASNYELEAFAYSVSHDLRAPLRSLDGFSRSLLDDYGAVLDDNAKDYLARIRAAARRMDELITALLSLSRITRSEMARRSIDITQLANESISDMREGLGPDVEFRVQAGMRARADERMTRAVFDNLIGNAVKFSGRKERPVIEIGQQGEAFFVRDNGVGFNPAYMSKLFAPFERLHSPKDFAGSGIGLATVQRIIHRHGGKVWAESEEGKGATFYFTLG